MANTGRLGPILELPSNVFLSEILFDACLFGLYQAPHMLRSTCSGKQKRKIQCSA